MGRYFLLYSRKIFLRNTWQDIVCVLYYTCKWGGTEYDKYRMERGACLLAHGHCWTVGRKQQQTCCCWGNVWGKISLTRRPRSRWSHRQRYRCSVLPQRLATSFYFSHKNLLYSRKIFLKICWHCLVNVLLYKCS